MMVKVERDKEMLQARFVSRELRTINEKTCAGQKCNTRRDGKRILLRPFYLASCSGIDCTAAFPSFPLFPCSHFPLLPAPSLDVLKGHVKYSGGIFITVLSGNARRLISLSARERRAKWIAKRGVKCIRLPVCPFLTLFYFRRDIALFLLNSRITHIRALFSVIIRKMSFLAAWAFAIECSSNAKLIPDSC